MEQAIRMAEQAERVFNEYLLGPVDKRDNDEAMYWSNVTNEWSQRILEMIEGKTGVTQVTYVKGEEE